MRRPLRSLALALALAVGGLLVAAPSRAASMFDPADHWQTIVTPHFRINFVDRDAKVAQLAAGYAEEAHGLLSPYLHSVPRNRTEVTLLDNEDTANGFGFPLPNNQIFVYLTSTSEDQFDSRYESYLRNLLLHEYTHVLHLEKTAGLPAWINGFFGRSYFPNMFEPVFLIEGLAVTTETMFSGGGRGRESCYRMYLREAALAHQLVTIDKAGGYYVTDHPGGEIPYVYGMAFYRYLMAHYGPQAPAALAEHYQHYPFFGFYGVDESLKAVTGGQDANALWAAMQAELTTDAERQAAAIRARGPLTPLQAVTHGGMYHRHPLYAPNGELMWGAYTGHGYSSLMGQIGSQPPRRIISKGPFGRWDISRDGRYLYHVRNWDDNRFTSFEDVFRYDTRAKKLERLSRRERLSEPAVSPDGRWVVAVKNGANQTQLVKCRADGTGPKAPLTPALDRAQFGGAAWHPRRDLLAVSAWVDGARDLYLVDANTGRMTPLWRDRDIEINPTWSPDGRYLLFASDRTGEYQIYAYELAKQQLFRMTNVLGGLVEPTVSPDGKRVAVASYGLKGWDIATFDWNPAAWQPVSLPASEANLHQWLPAGGVPHYAVRAYDPLPSLRPKTWSPFAFSDERGPVVGFTTFGQDSLIQHFLFGAVGYGLGSGRPFYSLSYANDVFYPSIGAYAMDTTLLQAPSDHGVTYQLAQRGLYQGLSLTLPGLPSQFLVNNWVTGDTLSFGLNLANVSGITPLPADLALAKAPPTGQTNTLSVTYKYGDNYKFAYSISPEGGNLFTLGYERAMPLLGSQYQFDRVWADWRRYLALPWAAHHVLGLRLSGGAANGDRGGNFYLGGANSSTVLTNVDLRTASDVHQAQVPLRGYGLGTLSGPKALALSAEYRFPLVDVERGYGIYPIFVSRLHGAIFAETGQAWQGPFLPSHNLADVGAELRAQTYLDQAPTQVRLGLGQGLVNPGSGILWPAVYLDIGSYF